MIDDDEWCKKRIEDQHNKRSEEPFEEQPNEPFEDSSKNRFEGRLMLKGERHG